MWKTIQAFFYSILSVKEIKKKSNLEDYLCFAQVVFLLQLRHVVLIWLKQRFRGELHDLEEFLPLGKRKQRGTFTHRNGPSASSNSGTGGTVVCVTRR